MTFTTTYTSGQAAAGVTLTSTVVQPSGSAPGTVSVYSPFPTLACDGNAYVVRGGTGQFGQLNLATGGYTALNNAASNGHGTLNAAAYNPTDNYVYALTGAGQTPPNQLVRISALGTSVLLNSINTTRTPGALTLTGAEVDAYGTFRAFSQINTQVYIYDIDLANNSATFGNVTRFTQTTSGAYNIYDWAITPSATGFRGAYNGSMVSLELS